MCVGALKRDHGGSLVSKLVCVWFVLSVWVRIWFVGGELIHLSKWVVRKYGLWFLASQVVVAFLWLGHGD